MHTLIHTQLHAHRLLEDVSPNSEDLAIVRYKLGTFYYVQVSVCPAPNAFLAFHHINFDACVM